MNRFGKNLRIALATFVLAVGIVFAYSAFSSKPAHAQGNFGGQVFKSAGPIQLNNSESALIGLLLPAVQRADTPFRLVLLDSMGRAFLNVPVTELGDGSVRTAYYNIYFADGSVRVLDHATGKVLVESRPGNGIFSVMLLPAVRKSGGQLGAVSASIQMFEAGKRGGIIAMCDGSV